MVKVGAKHSDELIVTEELIEKYAEISGDYNLIHIDDEYAKRSTFGRKIGHGLILMGHASKIIGMFLPGTGSILIDEYVKYLAPVYVNDTVMTTVSIASVKKRETGGAIIEVEIVSFNQDNVKLIEGTSKILMK